MSVEASCRKYLDAIAQKVESLYNFDTRYQIPTIGDILRIKDCEQGEAWDFRTKKGKALTNIPLPNLFTKRVWDELKDLNDFTNQRIHDGNLPKTEGGGGKPYFILPHSKYFENGVVESLKEAAVIVNLVWDKDELVIKDEDNLSGAHLQTSLVLPIKWKIAEI
jgi:hypothetical protein